MVNWPASAFRGPAPRSGSKSPRISVIELSTEAYLLKMNRYLTIVLLCIIIAVFSFMSGITANELARGGSLLAFATPLAQIIPGVYTHAHQLDIPALTDLSPLSTIWQVRDRIKTQYVYPIEDDSKLTYGAIKGMLATLKDPYSRFLAPEEFKAFQEETGGHFEGIGAVLQVIIDEDTGEQTIIIASVIPDGPTAKTKIRGGDQIIKVDEKPIKGLSLTEIVSRIRGLKGTEVKLTLIREGEPAPFEVSIVRADVEYPI